MVQNFTVFVDGAATAKIKTTKISSGGLGGGANSRKFAPAKISRYTVY